MRRKYEGLRSIWVVAYEVSGSRSTICVEKTYDGHVPSVFVGADLRENSRGVTCCEDPGYDAEVVVKWPGGVMRFQVGAGAKPHD